MNCNGNCLRMGHSLINQRREVGTVLHINNGWRVSISDDGAAEFELRHEAEISHVDHQQLEIG